MSRASQVIPQSSCGRGVIPQMPRKATDSKRVVCRSDESWAVPSGSSRLARKMQVAQLDDLMSDKSAARPRPLHFSCQICKAQRCKTRKETRATHLAKVAGLSANPKWKMCSRIAHFKTSACITESIRIDRNPSLWKGWSRSPSDFQKGHSFSENHPHEHGSNEGSGDSQLLEH